jgi:hypothetical protein
MTGGNKKNVHPFSRCKATLEKLDSAALCSSAPGELLSRHHQHVKVRSAFIAATMADKLLFIVPANLARSILQNNSARLRLGPFSCRLAAK